MGIVAAKARPIDLFGLQTFHLRSVRKVTAGITVFWRPSVHSDVAFWSFDSALPIILIFFLYICRSLHVFIDGLIFNTKVIILYYFCFKTVSKLVLIDGSDVILSRLQNVLQISEKCIKIAPQAKIWYFSWSNPINPLCIKEIMFLDLHNLFM